VDPYAPPTAVLEHPIAAPPMPSGIRRQILSAVVAGSVTVIFTLLHLLRTIGHTSAVYIAYGATAAVVISGLSYGIYRGGRTCAVLALLSYLPAHVWLVIRDGLSASAPITLLVACGYALGVIGTFRWRALRDEYRRAPPLNSSAPC